MAIEVATAEDLYNVRNDLTADYVQVADIDLSSYDNWEPIGNNAIFSGSYDGQGYNITGLTIDRIDESYIGLFGYLSCTDNTVELDLKNMNIIDANIRAGSPAGILAGYLDYYDGANINVDNISVSGEVYGIGTLGGLLGQSYGTVNIDNCDADIYIHNYVDGSYDNGAYHGGLIGYIWSYACGTYPPNQIKNSHATGRIVGQESAGGLIGYIDADTQAQHPNIENCYSEATIELTTTTESSSEFGGLIGWQTAGYLKDCYATGDVIGSKETSSAGGETYSVGGLVGWCRLSWSDYDRVEECYASGDVIGGSSVGGLIGSIEGNSTDLDIRVLNSYSTGNVDGNDTIGGFVGYVDDNNIFKHCYSKGKVTDVPDSGGFAGDFYDGSSYDYENIFDSCYYDKEVSGYNDTKSAEPKTTLEMKTQSTYENWDFGDKPSNLSDDYNNHYPALRADNGIWWIVEADNPYLVYFIEEPKTNIEPPSANSVTVKSPTAEYTAEPPNLSADRRIERIIEIDEGDQSVCKTVAQKLLSRWNRELKSVQGAIRLNQDLSFEQEIRVDIDESMTDQDMPIQELDHDVIEQITNITVGDIILSENELLARILEDL